MKFLLPLLMLISFNTFSQSSSVEISWPKSDAKYSVSDPIDTSVRIKIDPKTIVGPTVNIFTYYLVAKCIVLVKYCKTCEPFEVKCWRRSDSTGQTYWMDRNFIKSLKFNKRLIFVNWCDQDWID